MATSSQAGNETSQNASPLKDSSPSFKGLLYFASPNDKILIAVGCLCAIVYGSRYLVLAIVLGVIGNVLSAVSLQDDFRVIEDLNEFGVAPRSALDGYHQYSVFQQNFGLEASVSSTVVNIIYEMIIVSAVSTVLTWVSFIGMIITFEKAATNQVNRIRMTFMNSLLRQDIQWFDNCQAIKFISQTENDFAQYEDGIGFKFGQLVSYVAIYIFPLIYALIFQWRLALVGFCTCPIFYVLYNMNKKVLKVYSSKETKSFSNAGVVAEDVLTAFKTVISSNGQASETQRYTECLIKGRPASFKKAFMYSLGHALVITTLLCTFGLSAWYASHLYRTLPGFATQKNSVFLLLSITTVLNVAGIKLGEILGLFSYVTQSFISGQRLLKVINLIPPYDCDTNSHNKNLIETINDIEFEDVEFEYSNREKSTVLNGFNLHIKRGESVALVGHSGCGKSTIINLLLRFYDPTSGYIKINGIDLKILNLGWFRNLIGVVGQEPVLFPTTIYENIRYGFGDATQEDIETAAKMANAHDFIMSLPQCYQTNVGDRGTQLSGGQKQRVAIARALVRKPPILLLDEATSALDSQSEMIVQEALDKASLGRTSIIIAHRLSTIRNASKILVMNEGQIVECGTHNSLMEAQGFYYELVKVQTEIKSDDDNLLNSKIIHAKDKVSIVKEATEVDKFIINDNRNSQNIVKENNKQPSFFRLWTLGGWGPVFMVLGLLSSIAQGAAVVEVIANVLPLVNFIFENHDSKSVVGLHVYLSGLWRYGILYLISDFCMALFSSLSAVLIAQKLREKLFFSFMKQEVAWYEKPDSSVGNLCLILGHDIENVKSALGIHISTVVTVLSQTVTGLWIIFQISWEYGVAMCICFFISIVLAILIKQNLQKRLVKDTKIKKSSNEILRDIVMNIRTVRCLHAEEEFLKLYKMKTVVKLSKKSRTSRYLWSTLGSVIDTFSSVATICIGLLSPTLFLANKIVLLNYFRACGIAGMANSFGRSISAVPNVVSAVASVQKIYDIIDRKPKIDNLSREGKFITDDQPGTVKFEKVNFKYPSRPETVTLNAFELDVKSHQTVAIVGSSGSGKSTCVQLAARFYDPQSGSVLVCNELVKNANLSSLRKTMSIVQQEPMVFNRTIAENIAYGDLSRSVTLEEIMEASKIALVDDFINSLPQGYDTLVGNRGTQISGGQKQRIAIARAIIRKPKLFFLDEATSALDSNTDKELQQSLRSHKNNSTLVIIAHRLSTITDADMIMVVHNGKVVEKGNHQELMNLNGLYWSFHKNQLNANM